MDHLVAPVRPGDGTRARSGGSRSARFALALAVLGVASYLVSMVVPWYAADLDRLPLSEVPWGTDPDDLWPAGTALGVPAALAGLYAVTCAPLVGAVVAGWSAWRLWDRRRTDTAGTRAVLVAAAALSVATLGWLLTPVGSTLVTWWLD